MPATIQNEPFTPEKAAQIVEQFHRDGYYFVGPVLTPDEVAALRDAMDRKLADPRILADEAGDHIRGLSLMRMFEYDRAFRDLIAREPTVSLAEAILGSDCHMMSQNALRNVPGQNIGWHVDDRVMFPVSEGMERHDPRLRIPCFVMNVLIPLTDTDSIEFGPTEVVPGSHYSGRHPNDPEHPTFEGQGPKSLFAKAGDAYMFHNQVWHRGAPNTSTRVRYLGGVTYCQRVISQRLYPFIHYRMPEHVFEGADDRMRRLLGEHGKGAYG
jgi:ectoine hydroxylase-related dioxygenase (phytanoyl-CoA dioxygenase family)